VCERQAETTATVTARRNDSLRPWKEIRDDDLPSQLQRDITDNPAPRPLANDAATPRGCYDLTAAGFHGGDAVAQLKPS
jgi:hypothetical protein